MNNQCEHNRHNCSKITTNNRLSGKLKTAKLYPTSFAFNSRLARGTRLSFTYLDNPRNSTIFASANNCRSLSIIFELASAIFFAEARNEITLNSFGNYFGTLRHSPRQL
jgi:hypothetical protein